MSCRAMPDYLPVPSSATVRTMHHLLHVCADALHREERHRRIRLRHDIEIVDPPSPIDLGDARLDVA